MDQRSLNQRSVELIQHPEVRRRMWHAPMFWQVGNKDNPGPEELTLAKVDLTELEVLLAAAALLPSQCAAELNERTPGRADFIIRQVHRGERPLLSPRPLSTQRSIQSTIAARSAAKPLYIRLASPIERSAAVSSAHRTGLSRSVPMFSK